MPAAKEDGEQRQDIGLHIVAADHDESTRRANEPQGDQKEQND